MREREEERERKREEKKKKKKAKRSSCLFFSFPGYFRKSATTKGFVNKGSGPFWKSFQVKKEKQREKNKNGALLTLRRP